MSDMVERVARAMHAVRDVYVAGEYDAQLDEYKEGCLAYARAAIEAMREPTRAMIEDGYVALMEWDARTGEDYGIFEVWAAMIDAALRSNADGTEGNQP